MSVLTPVPPPFERFTVTAAKWAAGRYFVDFDPKPESSIKEQRQRDFIVRAIRETIERSKWP